MIVRSFPIDCGGWHEAGGRLSDFKKKAATIGARVTSSTIRGAEVFGGKTQTLRLSVDIEFPTDEEAVIMYLLGS